MTSDRGSGGGLAGQALHGFRRPVSELDGRRLRVDRDRRAERGKALSGPADVFAHSSYGGPLFVIDLRSAGSRLTVPRAPCRSFVKAFRSRIDACTLPERAGLDG
jgi:hypothetical protein